MGVGSAYFESAGQRSEHTVPGVYSRSQNVSSPSGVSASNYVILGSAAGGEFKKLLSFGSYSEAKETLISGNLLEAIGYAFKNSGEYTPATIHAMRIGSGAASHLSLSPLTLTAWDVGSHTNQLHLTLADGSETGTKKIKIMYKSSEEEIDNIGKASIKITNTGSSALSVSVNNEKITLGTTDLKFADYPTLSEMVSKINSMPSVSADIEGNEDDLTSQLDNLSSGSIATNKSLILKSNLQAIIEALEGCDYIGKVTVTGNRGIPANVTNSYFTGGTTTEPQESDWNDALDVLALEDIQIISTPSTETSIHALIAGHCKEMSNVTNRKERTFIVGSYTGISDDDGIAAAKALNTKLGSLVIDSAKANNPSTGKVEVISPGYVACILGAMESALAVNEALTFKEVGVIEFTNKRSIPAMTKLLKGGVLVCNANPENTSQNIVIRSVTTIQKNDLVDNERSMVRESMYMDRDLRNRFAGAIGRSKGISTNDVVQTLKSASEIWKNSGYIIDDVFDITVKESGDKKYLTYSRYLTAPLNFMFITVSNRIYESTTEV